MSDISNDDLRPNGHGCGADHASINRAVANKATARSPPAPAPKPVSKIQAECFAA